VGIVGFRGGIGGKKTLQIGAIFGTFGGSESSEIAQTSSLGPF
jgi:hypothetical protein